jgi:hypothetical protein
VCFGGGANISNDIAWLDCTPTSSTALQSVADGEDEDEDDPSDCGLDLVWGKPKSVEGSQPRPRLSHAAVRAGRHVVVYGGWGRTFAHDAIPGLPVALMVFCVCAEGELNDVQLLDMGHGASIGDEAVRAWGSAEQAAKAVRVPQLS